MDPAELTSKYQEKIKSKIDVAKFFTGFITLLVGLLLKEGEITTLWSKFGILFFVFSLVFSTAAIFSYDHMLWPKQHWLKYKYLSEEVFHKDLSKKMVRSWWSLFFPAFVCFGIGFFFTLIEKLYLSIVPSKSDYVCNFWLWIILCLAFLLPIVLCWAMWPAFGKSIVNDKNGKADKETLMETIKQHLDFLQKTSGETCSYLYPKELSSIQTFCLGLLERLSHTTLTLKTLFLEMEKELKHEFSAGILTRALLLDTLIDMNLFKLIKDAEAAGKPEAEIESLVKEFCETILSDGLEKTFAYLKSAKDFGFIDEQQLKNSYNNLAVVHKPFLNPHPGDGSKPDLKHKQFYAPTKLFQNLANTLDLKKVATLYDTYLYFSKYDHFGIMYYQVVREDHGKKLKIYLNAIEAFVAAQGLLHVVLAKYSANDDFLNSQAGLTNKYLLEKVISTL
jgi:hypothetical protein